jgi:uncharacterized protein
MYKSNVVMVWRKTGRSNHLTGSKCKECSDLSIPSRARCQKCRGNELEDFKFKGTGRIYSYSTIRSPPLGFERQVPYTIAIVKLDEGPKMTAQIVDFDNVEIGMEVECCLRKVYADGNKGIIHYGIKFRPLD